MYLFIHNVHAYILELIYFFDSFCTSSLIQFFFPCSPVQKKEEEKSVLFTFWN